MYDKLMGNFEKKMNIYTDALQEKAKDKTYSMEVLTLLFDKVKDEWRIFDDLITKMFFYELLTKEVYNQLYEDGYKKYREYFDTCVKVLIKDKE